MIYYKKIKMGNEKIEELNKYLEDGTVKGSNLKPEDTIFNESVEFEDGFYMELVVYTSKENVLATVSLYNAKGELIRSLDSDGGILAEYGIETETNKYFISIS